MDAHGPCLQRALGDDVVGGVGVELNRIGQDRIKRLRKNTDGNAEERGDPHRPEHVRRSLSRTHPAVMREEGEERDFDARVAEDTDLGSTGGTCMWVRKGSHSPAVGSHSGKSALGNPCGKITLVLERVLSEVTLGSRSGKPFLEATTPRTQGRSSG